MAFWSTVHNAGDPTALKDPKRKFRFRVDFTGLGDASFMWWAKTTDKPSFTINAAEHKYLNHTFYYPGSVTWNEVSITLVDPVLPDMAASISGLIEGGGYTPPASEDSFTTMTKASAVSAIGQVTVTQFDFEGTALETWTLYNAFITDVKYGDLAYGEDDLTEITLTLRYDWAKLVTGADTPGSSATAKEGSTFFAGSSAGGGGGPDKTTLGLEAPGGAPP